MKTSKSPLALLCASAMLTSPIPALAAEAPEKVLALQPSSGWNVNYGDESCRLSRVFGTGSDKTVLILDKFGLGSEVTVTIAGSPLNGLATKPVVLSFGPGGWDLEEKAAMRAQFGSFGPALIYKMNLYEGAPHKDPAIAKVLRSPPSDDPKEWQRRESALTYFAVTRGALPALRLEIGSMHQPMNALRACTNDLLPHWGLDAAAHKTLTRPATPKTSPRFWITNFDYPSDAIKREQQASVYFRLMVNESGEATSCHIQQASGPSVLVETVCSLMMKRAKFDPALDASGKPIRTVWTNNFVFALN